MNGWIFKTQNPNYSTHNIRVQDDLSDDMTVPRYQKINAMLKVIVKI